MLVIHNLYETILGKSLEHPIYIKNCSIIPMYPDINNLKENPNQMIIGVFPGWSGSAGHYGAIDHPVPEC